MQPTIVVVGSANLDMTLRTARVPGPGETLTGRSLTYAPGGKGANQAVAAARLGAAVRMVGKVGDDAAGEPVLKNLQENGIDTAWMGCAEGTPQGLAVIMVDDGGQNCIVLAAGSNGAVGPEDVEIAAPAFLGAHVVLLQNEIRTDATLRAAQIAKASGATVLWNPAPAPAGVPDGMRESVDILVPNESEAQVLSGVAVTDVDSARLAAEALRAQGYGTVVVTLGEKGALWTGPDGEHHVPAVPVTVVDTTAAGDTFIGALGVALAEGRTPEAALRFASAAAALAVTRLGAQAGIPTRAQLDAFRCG